VIELPAIVLVFIALPSSNIYNSRNDGRAINTNTIAGNTVQIISIVCPSNKNRFVIELKNKVAIIYPTKVVIKIKIIIA